jgi:hypothetical protein
MIFLVEGENFAFPQPHTSQGLRKPGYFALLVIRIQIITYLNGLGDSIPFFDHKITFALFLKLVDLLISSFQFDKHQIFH